MFGFSKGIKADVYAALFDDSLLGVAVIDKDHRVIATNPEMDSINGVDHPGEPIDAQALVPEVLEEAREHVDAVFLTGEPVFNAIVHGPKREDAREAYVCDYLPTPRTGEVEYVVSIARPLRIARRTGNRITQAANLSNAPLP